MPGFIRTPLIISAFITIYICVCAAVHPSLALNRDSLERQDHIRLFSSLEEEANILAQELLVLDIKVKKAESERDLVEKELALTRLNKYQAAALYQESLDLKKQNLKKIGIWANFQYRYGYWSLLDVILGSGSLAELVSRSMMVAVILERQTRDFRAAAEACNTARQREKDLSDLEGRLNDQNKFLEDQISSIRDLSTQRSRFLTDINSKSVELSRKVTELERKFIKSINLVDLVTGAMSDFPWHEIKPDRVSVTPAGIVMEMSEANLNKSLRMSGSSKLEGLEVNLRPGLFIINGLDKNSDSTFSFGGAPVPSPESGNIKIEPKTLTLDGIPAMPEVVREMAGSPPLYLRVPGEAGSFTISGIEIHNGIMVIVFLFQ